MTTGIRKAPPREASIVDAIAKHLRKTPQCLAIKTHGDVSLPAGTPDFIICYRGRYVALEVKRPGGARPTPIQRKRLADISAAGGYSCVVRSVADAANALREVDREIAKE